MRIDFRGPDEVWIWTDDRSNRVQYSRERIINLYNDGVRVLMTPFGETKLEPIALGFLENNGEGTFEGTKHRSEKPRYRIEQYKKEEMTEVPLDWIKDWFDHVCTMYELYNGEKDEFWYQLKSVTEDIREFLIQSGIDIDWYDKNVLDIEVKQRSWVLETGELNTEIPERDEDVDPRDAFDERDLEGKGIY